MIDQATEEALAKLSSSARRLLDYLAVLDIPARYAVLRHVVRAPEPDMVADLSEVVEAGLVERAADAPDGYDFVNPALRTLLLSRIGDLRLPKLRTRAQNATRRVSGDLREEP